MAPRRQKTQPNKAVAVEKRPRWAAFALGLVLIAATIAAHYPAIRSGFIWDDNLSLYENALVKAPDGLYRFWFTTEAMDYWPLTSTMFWLEWRIWGNNPAPYYVVNIALHALSAIVLWRILNRLGFNSLGALLGGLLFAVHPVTVESVAWVSERKNVLSMALYLLAILAYLRFEDQNRPRWYVFALLAAAAALLAKTSVVALPIVLLMLSWWRHSGMTWRAVIYTAPFFLLSLILGLATIGFQNHHAIAGDVVRPEGLASRIASVGWVFWFYLYKIVAPVNLAMIYPRWDIDGGRIVSFVPLVLMVACFVVLWRFHKGWGSGPLLALGSFAIVLTPVLGLLTMSYARHSLVADHLQYPGMPGLMALIGGGIGAARAWAQRNNKGQIQIGIMTLVATAALALGVLTWRQAQVYRDRFTLWNHTISLNDRAWGAYNDRGYAFADIGDTAKALADYSRTIELNPTYAMAFSNRGSAYTTLRNYQQAMSDCNKAIELSPTLAVAYNNRGNVYDALRDYARAIGDYSKAIQLKPDYADAYNNRGVAYDNVHNSQLAAADYDKALELRPDFAAVYLNLAVGHYELKQYDEAWADVNKCKQLGGKVNHNFVKALSKASGRPG